MAAAVVAFVREGTEVVRWPLFVQAPVDLEAVDQLARLHLLARRLGGRLAIRTATPRLRDLLPVVGLLGQVGRQPERREELGVEEVVVAHDPAVDDLEHLDGERGVPALGIDAVRPEGR